MYLICVLYKYILPTMFISQATNALQVSRPTWIEEWEKAPGTMRKCEHSIFQDVLQPSMALTLWFDSFNDPPRTNSQDLERLLRGGSNKPPPQYNKNGIHETASTTPYCLSSRKDTADTPITSNIIQDKHPPLFSLERVTTRWSPLKSP